MEMIDTAALATVLGTVEVLGAAFITGLFAYFTKRAEVKAQKQREEDREEAERQRKADLEYREERERLESERQERDEAIYGVVLTTARGTELLLQQAHGEKLNGNVEAALTSMNKAIGRYNNLANKHMAHL